MRLLVRGAVPVTTGDPPDPVDVLVEDGRIAAVLPHRLGPGPDPADGTEVLDARGRLVLAGLVNAHHHSHDRFDRGRHDALPLEIWRTAYNPPGTARRWTPEEVHLRTLLDGAELLRGGTTTVLDDAHLGPDAGPEHAEAVLSAYQRLGLRAVVSSAWSDLPSTADLPFAAQEVPAALHPPAASARRRQEVLETWAALAGRHRGGRVGFALSPSAPLRCSPGFLAAVGDLARQLDVPVFCHLLETRAQRTVDGGGEPGARRLLDRVERAGLLTASTVLVHGVWLPADQAERVAAAGSTLVHCPGSNLKLGSGVADVRTLLDAGVRVRLGTDNVGANDSTSLLETTKLAALVSRGLGRPHHRWVRAGEALAAATGHAPTGPAGTLRVGAPADLVLLDAAADAFTPAHDLVHQTVFAASAADVRDVVVDGRVVVRDRRVRTVDEPALRAELAERWPAIRQRIRDGETEARAVVPHLTRAYERWWDAETADPRPPGTTDHLLHPLPSPIP